MCVCAWLWATGLWFPGSLFPGSVVVACHHTHYAQPQHSTVQRCGSPRLASLTGLVGNNLVISNYSFISTAGPRSHKGSLCAETFMATLWIAVSESIEKTLNKYGFIFDVVSLKGNFLKSWPDFSLLQHQTTIPSVASQNVNKRKIMRKYSYLCQISVSVGTFETYAKKHLKTKKYLTTGNFFSQSEIDFIIQLTEWRENTEWRLDKYLIRG